jgi:hypothetical protein
MVIAIGSTKYGSYPGSSPPLPSPLYFYLRFMFHVSCKNLIHLYIWISIIVDIFLL